MKEPLKKPKAGGSQRVRKLYEEILKRPFSSELVDVLKKKEPESKKERGQKKIAKDSKDVEI